MSNTTPYTDKEPKRPHLSLLNGIDVKRVQASLGHATAAFTLDVYGHVTAGGLRDAAAKLDQAIFGK